MIRIKVKLVFAVILLFSALFGAFAQTNSDAEIEILNAINKRAETFNNSLSNEAYLQQIGNNNVAAANQIQTHGYTGNLGVINQFGDFNEAYLSELGSGISGTINQNGNYNYANLNLVGNNLNSNVDQSGNNNSVEQEIAGENLSFGVIQQGYGNELIQKETDGSAIGYSIIQNGVGIKTIIINGNIYLP